MQRPGRAAASSAHPEVVLFRDRACDRSEAPGLPAHPPDSLMCPARPGVLPSRAIALDGSAGARLGGPASVESCPSLFCNSPTDWKPYARVGLSCLCECRRLLAVNPRNIR